MHEAGALVSTVGSIMVRSPEHLPVLHGGREVFPRQNRGLLLVHVLLLLHLASSRNFRCYEFRKFVSGAVCYNVSQFLCLPINQVGTNVIISGQQRGARLYRSLNRSLLKVIKLIFLLSFRQELRLLQIDDAFVEIRMGRRRLLLRSLHFDIIKVFNYILPAF